MLWWRQSQRVDPHHWGVWVGVCRQKAVFDHVVIGVGHPGTTAAIGTIRSGAVHQVLFTQRHKLTCPLVYLSLNSSCGAEGPARATVTLWISIKTYIFKVVHDSVYMKNIEHEWEMSYLVFHLSDIAHISVVDNHSI